VGLEEEPAIALPIDVVKNRHNIMPIRWDKGVITAFLMLLLLRPNEWRELVLVECVKNDLILLSFSLCISIFYSI